MDFDLDIDDAYIPALCPVLGIVLKAEEGPLTDASPSLDRVDTSKGYVKGNVAVISMRANRLKSDGTLAELERVVAWLKARI